MPSTLQLCGRAFGYLYCLAGLFLLLLEMAQRHRVTVDVYSTSLHVVEWRGSVDQWNATSGAVMQRKTREVRRSLTKSW